MFGRIIRSLSQSASGSDDGDASSPYYIYCSEVAIPSSESNSATSTTFGTALDTFVRCLQYGFIKLSRAPKANDNGSWISIDSDDELNGWFGKAFLGFSLNPGGFSACWSTSDPVISKFKLELGGPASFTFDTDSASEVFSSHDGSTITSTNVVILGLTGNSDKYNPTLGDVVGLAGLRADYGDALGDLKDIKLVLNPTQTDLFGAAADLPSFVEDILVDVSKDGTTFEIDICQAQGYLVFSESLRIAPLKCTCFSSGKRARRSRKVSSKLP